ncbi:hypothetical protein B0H13DRAFT_1905216 [Mycena leptocephala]|nr:hypothetical protein B0H13DRAFT_1905216 [Mycena leptocephala]
MIRSGRRGEKEGARDGRGEGNTWEIRGRREKLREEILTGDSQGGAELLEERRDGDSSVKPQEPESDLGGGKVVGDTRMCAEFEVRASGVQKAATGLETGPAGQQRRRGTAVAIRRRR